MWLLVHVAKFPNDGIDPLVSQLFFRIVYFDPFATIGNCVNLCQSLFLKLKPYDVVKPFTHSSRKVLKNIFLTRFDFFALSIVVDVHVFLVLTAFISIAYKTVYITDYQFDFRPIKPSIQSHRCLRRWQSDCQVSLKLEQTLLLKSEFSAHSLN